VGYTLNLLKTGKQSDAVRLLRIRRDGRDWTRTSERLREFQRGSTSLRCGEVPGGYLVYARDLSTYGSDA
jgi:hypothetical protein